MGFEELKRKTMDFIRSLSKRLLVKTVLELRDKIYELYDEISKLKNEIQRLKDELNKTKGLKGKPSVKPNVKTDAAVDKAKNKDRKKNWKKSKKKGKIKITRTERLKVDKSSLPEDAEYKGTRSVVIQDIKIDIDNVEFKMEKYYSKEKRKTYEAQIPEEYADEEFGPGLRSLILFLHYKGRITQKRLHSMLTGMGIIISEGQICKIIKDHDLFQQEREEARRAAIEKRGYQHIDDTGARLNGKNGFTIATCNDYFTSYETGLKKDRLSALKALVGGKELVYLIDDFAVKYLKTKLPGKAIWKKLIKWKSDLIYDEQIFISKVLNNPEITTYGQYCRKHIQESCAIAAFRAGHLGMSIQTLVCDDAGQFKGLTEYLQLCWIHEARHYKKLEPAIDTDKKTLDTFMDDFWSYYKKLKLYKKNPSDEFAKKLRKEFDTVFSPTTNYWGLNKIIKATIKKKDALLVVLIFPEVPLHNNECELDVREKVIQRKIRNCYRSLTGARASDIFLSLMAICRKNNISFWEYLKDRIYKINNILPLAEIIKQTPA